MGNNNNVKKYLPVIRTEREIDFVRTSTYYKTYNLPRRFDYPQIFSNYGCHKQPQVHPFYVTTSSEYGFYPPSHHTVPTCYYPQNHSFSSNLAAAGMYRNFSLNI